MERLYGRIIEDRSLLVRRPSIEIRGGISSQVGGSRNFVSDIISDLLNVMGNVFDAAGNIVANGLEMISNAPGMAPFELLGLLMRNRFSKIEVIGASNIRPFSDLRYEKSSKIFTIFCDMVDSRTMVSSLAGMLGSREIPTGMVAFHRPAHIHHGPL